MTLVVATGVFEVIHPGHILYLTESRKLGDRLAVIVASDESVRKSKGRVVVPEKQRLKVVEALKVVDEAVVGDRLDYAKPIRKLKPDVVTLGPDQRFTVREVKRMLLEAGVDARVVRISRRWRGGLNSSKKIKRLYYKV
jgi:FAD synthetase